MYYLKINFLLLKCSSMNLIKFQKTILRYILNIVDSVQYSITYYQYFY